MDCLWGPYLVEVDNCTTTATEPATGDDKALLPDGSPDPAGEPGSGQCFPHGWAAFNPVQWVYKPVKCALVWAFVPREAVVLEATASLSDAWEDTALGTVTAATTAVMAPVVNLKDDPGPTDCNGPAFVIPQLPAMSSALTLHPMSTCNELTTYLLGIYLPIASALIYLGGFFAGTRTLLKGFSIDGGIA